MYRGSVAILGAIALTACTPFAIGKSEADPAATAGLSRQAGIAYEQQSWPEAERLYLALKDRVVESEPWFRLGNIYAWTDRPEQAIEAYRQALAREPENAKVWHNLGIVQLRQAAASFATMRDHLAGDDPLVQRSQKLSEGIDALIQGD